MKKYTGILLMIMVLLVSGCGSKVSSDTVSMYDLRVAMEAADDSLPTMLNASSTEDSAKENFAYFSDLEYDKVDSYFLSYSEDGSKADEIAVIAVKDPADVQEAKKSLEEHKEERYKLLEQYEPEQTRRIEEGLVFTSGQYAVLVICDDSSAVKAAFQEIVSE